MNHPLSAVCEKPVLTVAGLMSGTSADGIDACIAEIREGPHGPVPRLRAHLLLDHDPVLKALLLELGEVRDRGGPAGPDRVELVARANAALGQALGEAVLAITRAAGLAVGELDLVGSHGQTVRHVPGAAPIGRLASRATLQIGDAAVIAEVCGVPVVADFRVRDVAAGGLGAPLVPHVDRLLLSEPGKRRAVQNFGGIGNVTHLPDPDSGAHLLAFDTGPGNMVIDAVVRRMTGGAEEFDRDGLREMAGTADSALVDELLDDDYSKQVPPKNLGREQYGAAFVDRFLALCERRGVKGNAMVATATLLTARATAEQYRRFLVPRGGFDEVVVSGGGALNPSLLGMLALELHAGAPGGVLVVRSDDRGIPALAKEALAFAVLAYEFVRARPGNCPEATGARRPVVLGKLSC